MAAAFVDYRDKQRDNAQEVFSPEPDPVSQAMQDCDAVIHLVGTKV